MVDLGAGFAMPGLVDTHVHPSMSGGNRVFCGFPRTFYEPTEAEILDLLRQCVAEFPEDREWFVGEGFTPSVMTPEGLSRKMLDEILPDRPAYIVGESGHNAWVNSKAFEAAGITKETPDSDDGYFERDPQTGELTGRVLKRR